MKKTLHYIFFVVLIYLISCDSEDGITPPIVIPERATVTVFYTIVENNTERIFPDINSFVYVYYDINEDLYTYNMDKQSIALNGIIVNYDGSEILPTNTYQTNDNGTVNFPLKETNNTITIVTFSSFYKRSSISRFSSNIDYTITYNSPPITLSK